MKHPLGPSLYTAPDASILQIMEAIGEDFRERFKTADLSENQIRLLDERRTRVANGPARLLNWDDVKDSLRKR